MRALFLAAVFFGACAAPRSARWPDPHDRLIQEKRDSLLVGGVGAPDPKAEETTQRRSTSRDAALADARRRLRAYLQSVFQAEEDSAALDLLARSAVPVSTRWDERDEATAVLRLDKARVSEALESSYR